MARKRNSNAELLRTKVAAVEVAARARPFNPDELYLRYERALNQWGNKAQVDAALRWSTMRQIKRIHRRNRHDTTSG